MNTLNPSNGYLKFNCIYCGQHMECAPRLAGRQFLCPACQHRIVIPAPRGGTIRTVRLAAHTWDKFLPSPDVEIPTRHRCRTPASVVLAPVA